MYEVFHIAENTIYLNQAVADRIFQLLGDMVFLQMIGLVFLVLILGAVCFGLFRAK